MITTKNMKSIHFISFALFLAVMTQIFVSCTSDLLTEDKASKDEIAPKVILSVTKQGFDQQSTRSIVTDGKWEDGDVLWVLFSLADGGSSIGYLEYKKSTDEWEIHYDKSLTKDKTLKCKVCYLDGYTKPEDWVFGSNTTMNLTSAMGLYVDENGEYSYTSADNYLTISAKIAPVTSRIRFKGTASQQISVRGISTNTKFDLSSFSFTKSDASLSPTVASDGYTPYIYGTLSASANNTLTVIYGSSYFDYDCSSNSNILKVGKSGWMNIPTKDNHNGWTATVLESNDHAFVDLGLTSGTLWATMNVGATSPEDYGDYFAWGETKGYKSGKTSFSWSTYSLCGGSSSTMKKYCVSSDYGTVDDKTELELADDVARANWGGDWRMPSSAQIDELISECTTTWATQNGVSGRKVTSKKNGNSLFLPFAGFRSNSTLNSGGSYGYYWSRSLNAGYSNNGYGLSFYSSYFIRSYSNRYYGQSVRPVLSK